MTHDSHSREAAIRRSEALARFLDNSIPIPGTGYKIGWDAIIGLIPGVGDILAGILSTYIVVQAIEQGASRATVLRMALNVAIETVVGAVPVLGDLFDAAWKANVRNARLLETSLRQGSQAVRRDRWFMALVVLGLVLALGVAAAFGFEMLRLLRDWIVSLS